MGKACCIRVRATVAVRRWRPTSTANASMARLRSVDQGVDRGLEVEHERSIDHVPTGRAPVHKARGRCIGLADLRGEGLDQGDDDIAGNDRRLRKGGKFIVLGTRGVRDRIDDERGNNPHRRLRACQRNLEIEHALQARAIVKNAAHGGARKHRCKQ